jgi:hypothetical protein
MSAHSGACRSTEPSGLGTRWACSLPTGHKGPHKAKLPGGTVVKTWARKGGRR